MQLLINVVRGFCMALADSVPGVSGGTVAFILGFYDKFIGSLAQRRRGKRLYSFWSNCCLAGSSAFASLYWC